MSALRFLRFSARELSIEISPVADRQCCVRKGRRGAYQLSGSIYTFHTRRCLEFQFHAVFQGEEREKVHITGRFVELHTVALFRKKWILKVKMSF